MGAIPIKFRRMKLAFIQASYFALAGLTAVVIQTVLIAPLHSAPPLVQPGTNHYLLALEQVEGLKPSHVSPFLSTDPFRSKPKTDTSFTLKENPELAKILAVKAFLWGVIYYGEGTYSNFTAVSPYRLILGEEAFSTGAYTRPEFGYQRAKSIEELWKNYRIVLEAEQSLLSLSIQ